VEEGRHGGGVKMGNAEIVPVDGDSILGPGGRRKAGSEQRCGNSDNQ
jgi:hypothetical protein